MGTYVLQQLGYGGPLLVVYLVGIILSAIFLRKYPFPMTLALAGCLILFLNLIIIAMTQGYFIRARMDSTWSGVQISQMSMIISTIGALFRALGTALLVAALFIGRGRKPASEPA